MYQQADKVIQAIIVITAIFTVVALFVIAYVIFFNRKKSILIAEKNALKEQFYQQLLKSQVEIQEYTFLQIGKELHDNVGQLLSTSKMLIGLTERSLANPPDSLLTANATLAHAIVELRSLAKSLDKEWLQQFRFSDNLSDEVARLNSGNSVQAVFNSFYEMELESEKQIILFRIVQEAIQNAVKHGRPTCIEIVIDRVDNQFCISVSDNGIGFTGNEPKNGMGLRNMKHRTALLGGTIAWDSILGTGTTVNIYLPIKNEVG
jgi:signal transduction histidine kinase